MNTQKKAQILLIQFQIDILNLKVKILINIIQQVINLSKSPLFKIVLLEKRQRHTFKHGGKVSICSSRLSQLQWLFRYSYEIYYIIDFDEGYVYSFTEGNGNDTCDRLKIESGDLNDVVVITYHDSGDEWSYGLHFKYKNQPDHLIMEDNDYFEYDYYSTNLDNALKIRDSKTIHDY